MQTSNGQEGNQKSFKIPILRPPADYFAWPSSVVKSSRPPCEANSSPFHALWPQRRRRDLLFSPISGMARIRGGHTNPFTSHEVRPSASAPQDPSQASKALNVPYSEGGVPSSPLQCRYLTRRLPTSPPPELSVCRIPPKRDRISGHTETSS